MAHGTGSRNHDQCESYSATPAGLEVVADVELVKVEGRKLTFWVKAHDGVDLISQGYHERIVINKQRFTEQALSKL